MPPRHLVAFLLAIASRVPAQGPLPDFLGIDFGVAGYFEPTGIADDGSVIVGGSYILGQGNKARRWREGIGFDYPGPNVNPNIASWCSGVSGDGSVVAGGNGHAVFGDLEGWMRYGASVGHVGSPPGHDTSDCLAVSHDGVVTVGYGGLQSHPNLFEAALYTEVGGWVNLGFLPGGNDSKATAVSADGAVIAGWSTSSASSVTPAWRWTAATGMVSLGVLPGGAWSEPTCMSADGSVIYGHDDLVAWRWTAATGIQPLSPQLGISRLLPTACSPDGEVVVGEKETVSGLQAFVWDAAHDVVDLRELLLAQGLTQLGTWSLATAGAIAGNGPWTIAGGGDDGIDNRSYRVRLGSLDPATFAGYDTYGSGCVGSLGAPALQAAGGSLPVLGGTLVLQVDNLPLDLGLLALGLSDTQSGAEPLPFDLSVIGMTGCELLADPVVLYTLLGTGHAATWTWNVPSAPALAGTAFFNQAFAFDPPANPFGLTASNGGAGVLGL